MRDTIQEDDLYIDISKTELEKQMQKDRKKIELLQEQAKDRDVTIEQLKERDGERNNKMEELLKIVKALQMERMIETRY